MIIKLKIKVLYIKMGIICYEYGDYLIDEILSNTIRYDIVKPHIFYKNTGFYSYDYMSQNFYKGSLEEAVINTNGIDFTIEAILKDSDKGDYVDFFGGLDDIKNKVLKTIDEPNEQIKNYPLIILKTLRFSVTKSLKIDDILYQAIINPVNYKRLESHSFEYSIIPELNKMFLYDMVETINVLSRLPDEMKKILFPKNVYISLPPL